MPVYRTGNSFSDTKAGTDNAALARVIRGITVGNRRRIAGKRLDPAGTPAPVGPARAVAARKLAGDAATGGGGIESPIVEQPYTGETFYYLTSSDGLFTWEFGAETTTIDADGAGVTHVWKHLDPQG